MDKKQENVDYSVTTKYPRQSAGTRVTLVTAGNHYRVLIRPFGAQFCFDADKAFACRKFFFQNDPANLLDPCG
jgi:hypothetical protein